MKRNLKKKIVSQRLTKIIMQCHANGLARIESQTGQKSKGGKSASHSQIGNIPIFWVKNERQAITDSTL